METSLQGVFAGGDAVTGPATVIEAILAGKRAAGSIENYLKKLSGWWNGGKERTRT
jgi:NADPH-dependent glutamate synthase beta subunit-like oxidoreductase